MPHASLQFYLLVPSPFGEVGIVWNKDVRAPRVQRIFLPRTSESTEKRIRDFFARASLGSSNDIDQLARRVRAFLEGEPVTFDPNLTALDTCSPFQREVILAEHDIPRGWVSTYSRIARHLGRTGAARAVGTALARNPFPIIIPCHRAVRSDGSLGGYQGGPAMKRTLLEMEGVVVSEEGKVIDPKFYY